MLTLAALAHFDLPSFAQNLRAGDALARFGPSGLAWVEAGPLALGVLTWQSALAQPHALAAQLAEPLSPALASPHSSANTLIARNQRLGANHWRIYQGTKLTGLVWGPDVKIWAQVQATRLEQLLKTQFGSACLQHLASMPVGLAWQGAGVIEASARARAWLGQGPDLKAGPPQRPAKRWGLLVRGQTARGTWSVCWKLKTNDLNFLPGLMQQPFALGLEGPEGIYLWRRDE